MKIKFNKWVCSKIGHKPVLSGICIDNHTYKVICDRCLNILYEVDLSPYIRDVSWEQFKVANK